MAVRRRTTSGRDVHIEQAVTAISVLAGKNDRVGVCDKSDVRQALVRFRLREFERAVAEVSSGDGRGGLGSDGVFVHGGAALAARYSLSVIYRWGRQRALRVPVNWRSAVLLKADTLP